MLYLSNGLGVARLVLPFKASLDETTWNAVEVNFYFLTRRGWKAKILQKSLIPPFLFINKIQVQQYSFSDRQMQPSMEKIDGAINCYVQQVEHRTARDQNIFSSDDLNIRDQSAHTLDIV